MKAALAASHGLARVISKRGLCSRSMAETLVREGKVRVAGRIVRDPCARTAADAQIRIDGLPAPDASPRYLMLNKPRGLVTTARDEHGRDTVYRCFDGHDLGWIAPVGRLDKASEGLLLFSNDPAWAAHVTDPATGPAKTYHVQVDTVPDETLLARIAQGTQVEGERLAARQVALLRHGEKSAWLQIVLEEGRNRHIRRLLQAFGIGVRRLVRVAIGELVLGDLAKGQWRALAPEEVARLGGAA